MLKQMSALGRCLALMVLASLVVTCDGKGPDPEPVKYNVYFGMSDQGDLYVLDADSLTIIDSIPDIDWATGLAVSPGGSWLFAESGKRPVKPLSLKKIDVRTKEIAGVIPDAVFNTVHLLDEGRLLTRGISLCHKTIIATGPFVETGSLDDSLCGMRGPLSGTRIAVLIAGTNRLRGCDVATGIVFGEYAARLTGSQTIEVVDAVLHPDGRRVLALGAEEPDKSWFVIGDLETGQTLLEHRLIYPQGQITVSDDGAVAAVTDPSQFGFWYTDPTIDIFDLVSMTHVKRFTGGAAGDIEGHPGQVRFVPGTKLLIASPNAREGTNSPIHVINVSELRVNRIIYPPFSSGTPTALAIGVRPE